MLEQKGWKNLFRYYLGGEAGCYLIKSKILVVNV